MNKLETREQAEARALELYPEIKIKGEPVLDELWNEVLDDENKGKRQAYLQCWDEMQHDKSELYDGTLQAKKYGTLIIFLSWLLSVGMLYSMMINA